MADRITPKHGSVLVICLMVLVVLCVLCLWSQKLASINRKTAFNHVGQLQAYYLAEAGFDLAMEAIRENPLWRGNDTGDALPAKGTISLDGMAGYYAVTVYDATDDENGKWDSNLQGGMLTIMSEGFRDEFYQVFSCNIRLTPSLKKVAASPRIAIISAGEVTVSGGKAALTGLNELGQDDPFMIQKNTPLPKVNQIALKAMADVVFVNLDDAAFDARLSARDSFWRDPLEKTVPYVIWISGDLTLSQNRVLYGIVFVEGERAILTGEAHIDGIIYSPNAKETLIPGQKDGGFGVPSVKGQVITGIGGVKSTSAAIGVQLDCQYVEALNNMQGEILEAAIVSGSWHRP